VSVDSHSCIAMLALGFFVAVVMLNFDLAVSDANCNWNVEMMTESIGACAWFRWSIYTYETSQVGSRLLSAAVSVLSCDFLVKNLFS